MSKAAAKSEATERFLGALQAGLLAWLIPGAGHWYLRRPVRAVILFVTIHGLFWAGVAIGGIFTVNPRHEAWWCRAQMGTGASGLFSYGRQLIVYRHFEKQVASEFGQLKTSEMREDRIEMAIANDGLALVPPARDPAYVFTGVAGMLNIMCVFDVIILSLMGRLGEGPAGWPGHERREGS